MKNELEKKLAKKYPEIFADANKPETENLMCYGCSCGNGWYELLDSLCYALQNTTKKYGEPQVVGFQIKEKFGTLRFYCNGTTTIQDALIGMAEDLSGKICEKCGDMANVSLREGPWIRTLCDTCENERNGKTKIVDTRGFPEVELYQLGTRWGQIWRCWLVSEDEETFTVAVGGTTNTHKKEMYSYKKIGEEK